MAGQRIPQESMMMVNGGDAATFVSGDKLKQVDTPTETVLGAANGALTGGLLSAAVSGAVTIGNGGNYRMALKNITGSHLLAVLGGTAATAALGALERNSRARMHNQWSERHYAFLEQQEQNHTAAIDAERKQAVAQPATVGAARG